MLSYKYTNLILLQLDRAPSGYALFLLYDFLKSWLAAPSSKLYSGLLVCINLVAPLELTQHPSVRMHPGASPWPPCAQIPVELVPLYHGSSPSELQFNFDTTLESTLIQPPNEIPFSVGKLSWVGHEDFLMANNTTIKTYDRKSLISDHTPFNRMPLKMPKNTLY